MSQYSVTRATISKLRCATAEHLIRTCRLDGVYSQTMIENTHGIIHNILIINHMQLYIQSKF